MDNVLSILSEIFNWFLVVLIVVGVPAGVIFKFIRYQRLIDSIDKFADSFFKSVEDESDE